MALDAWRSGDAYRVALDLPGVDPDSIELICERNGLTIRAERAADYGEQDEVLIAGRPVGTFTRQLILSGNSYFGQTGPDAARDEQPSGVAECLRRLGGQEGDGAGDVGLD
jgi:hypothetical protein